MLQTTKAETVKQIAALPDTKVAFFVDDEEANCRAVEDAVNGVVCVTGLDGLKDL